LLPARIAVRFAPFAVVMAVPAGRGVGPLGCCETMVVTDMVAAREWLAGNRVLIWLVAGIGGLVIHVLLWQVSEPSALFSDFYKANWQAAETLWEYGLGAIWPLSEKGGFSNLPVIGWLYVPLVVFGEENAGWAFWVLGIAALSAAWALLTRLASLAAPLAAALMFLFFINGPVVNSLREGQTSHFILLLLVVALLLWQAKREYAAGVVLGFCAMIKLPLLLLGLYFLLKQRWRIVAGGAAAIGVIVMLSLALFGLSGNIGWYQEWVAPYLGHAIPAFNVQSIDGFLVRLEWGETYLRYWDPPIVPSLFHVIARSCAFAALFGGTFWLIRRADRIARPGASTGGPSPRDLLEFVLVLNLALITSPISWTHYYCMLLLPCALYLGGQLPLPDDATTRALMRIGCILVSVPIVMWAGEEMSLANAVLARTAVSVWLFGGLLMFAALARGLWRIQAGMTPSPAPLRMAQP
jgi:hypothetical protein